VICDMKTPGITVRPFDTMLLNDPAFSEVFYDNARIPLTNVVGGLHDGWRTAMSTLSFERGTAFIERQLILLQSVERLIALARTHAGADGRPLIENEGVAGRLGRLRGEVAAMRAMAYLSVSRTEKQGLPGPEGTFPALYFSELTQNVSR